MERRVQSPDREGKNTTSRERHTKKRKKEREEDRGRKEGRELPVFFLFYLLYLLYLTILGSCRFTLASASFHCVVNRHCCLLPLGLLSVGFLSCSPFHNETAATASGVADGKDRQDQSSQDLRNHRPSTG